MHVPLANICAFNKQITLRRKLITLSGGTTTTKSFIELNCLQEKLLVAAPDGAQTLAAIVENIWLSVNIK